VRGAGVVGQQPLIDPGQSHTYSSGTVMTTKVGTMQGSYQMFADDGKRFDAIIALPPGGARSPALMATYAVGDLQGCLQPLKCLLERVAFDPASIACGWWATWSTAAPIAGNPALPVLHARVAGVRTGQPRPAPAGRLAQHRAPEESDTLREIIEAPDATDLLDWLRQQSSCTTTSPRHRHGARRHPAAVDAAQGPQVAAEVEEAARRQP
jgi:hypothetical protein